MTRLWRHQLDAIEWAEARLASGHKYVVFAHGMGSGKTRTTLEFLARQMQPRGISRVLVCCPKAVIPAWARQAGLWVAGVRVVLLDKGGSKDKAKAVEAALADTSPVIIVVNYDSAWRIRPIEKVRWDAIVHDEIHRLKAPSGSASRWAGKLCKNNPDAIKVGLSGTLIPHSILDVWAIYRALESPHCATWGDTFTLHRARYAVTAAGQNRFPGRAKPTPASAALPTGMVEVPLIEPSEALQKVQQDRDEKQQLAEIDRRFREMVLQDAATWDLDSLEAAYRELQGRLKNPQISGAVELRYGALQRYRQRLAELQQVRQLQSQTEQRDAALAARHGFASMMPPAVPTARIAPPRIAAVPVEPAPVVPAPAESATGGVIVDAAAGAAEVDEFVTPTPDSALPPSGSNSNSGMLVSQSRSVAEQSVSAEAAVEPLTAAVSGAGVIRPGSPQNKYVGAGIVQRSPDAGGAWVLTAPAGKVLANLKPAAGVQLERFAGRQVGILGMRWSQKDQRDMIEVRGLEPVQLTP